MTEDDDRGLESQGIEEGIKPGGEPQDGGAIGLKLVAAAEAGEGGRDHMGPCGNEPGERPLVSTVVQTPSVEKDDVVAPSGFSVCHGSPIEPERLPLKQGAFLHGSSFGLKPEHA